ncbi:pyridoxal phosphate-dependent aminotransferase [Streptomyces hokutonensis]|uniref:pyridoxal phosphate-dependent aminotransferase n=1 Tax=Streptomyces hokutonensis TaxID=1306990 RepID=UPI0037FA730B
MKYEASAPLVRLRSKSTRPASFDGPPGTVSLAVGDPDFATPEPVLAAATEALRSGWTHYADWDGDPELRSLITEVENRRAAASYDVGNVMIGHGATAVLFAAVMTVVDPGDRVVIPEPTYSLYADFVLLAGGIPVFVPLRADFHLDLDRLASELATAKLLLLCSPNNPTGAVLTRGELESVARLAAGTGTWIISDEAYSELVYTDDPFVSCLQVTDLTDRLIYCQTLSKTYAMTGWRVGYALAPAEVAEGMRQLHRTVNGALNSAVQRAAIVALQHGPALAEPMLRAYRERREAMHDRIAAIDRLSADKPDGAFYTFARYEPDLDSVELSARLRSHGVVVRAGREYGPTGEGHLRLSFATDLDTIAVGLDRIAEVLDLLP